MKRSSWMSHKGKRILFINFADTKVDGVNEAIAEAKPMISSQPPESVLFLVDTTGTSFSLDISSAVKEFTMHNKPFMKMTALVGVEGLQKIILNSVIMFTKRRNLVVKNSREEALDWLVDL